MGHNLRALIGKPPAVEALAARFANVQRVPLPQGFVMVPLVNALYDEMAFVPEACNPEAAVGGWSRLGTRAEAVLAEVSRTSPVAYVCTEYFGGVGEQAALAFVGGRRATRHGGEGKLLPWAASTGPINSALRAIGAVRESERDEFDSLGLGRFRDMEDLDGG